MSHSHIQPCSGVACVLWTTAAISNTAVLLALSAALLLQQALSAALLLLLLCFLVQHCTWHKAPQTVAVLFTPLLTGQLPLLLLLLQV